jgi:hypothetical protein
LRRGGAEEAEAEPKLKNRDQVNQPEEAIAIEAAA